mmetsp:Transcript_4019/g.8610  ORF Transcript_4019/g.8610 Transcript_4019/m.8610 type:complete len:209 (-) Transcript_4019:564-1190(-)
MFSECLVLIIGPPLYFGQGIGLAGAKGEELFQYRQFVSMGVALFNKGHFGIPRSSKVGPVTWNTISPCQGNTLKPWLKGHRVPTSVACSNPFLGNEGILFIVSSKVWHFGGCCVFIGEKGPHRFTIRGVDTFRNTPTGACGFGRQIHVISLGPLEFRHKQNSLFIYHIANFLVGLQRFHHAWVTTCIGDKVNVKMENIVRLTLVGSEL